MQSSYDRDKYVRIIPENMSEDWEEDFQKYSSWEVSHLNVPYDLNSVMHYNSWGHSRNGKATMVRRVGYVALLYQLI